MDAEHLVEQASRWLDNAHKGTRVEALLDLPRIGWVELKKLSNQGARVKIAYRGLTTVGPLDGVVELTCEKKYIRAVRRCTIDDGQAGPDETLEEPTGA
jgi:hypothetical protein